jgi:multiple sugar transport system permease protein
MQAGKAYPGKRAGIWRDMKRSWKSYLLLSPYLAIFGLFVIVPVGTAVFLSFTYFNILEPPVFVGLNNYIRLFVEDDVFLIAVKNTLILSVITGPIGFIASFILAWMINEITPKIRALVILIFYAPTISGQVYFIWKLLFSGDAYGFVNGFLLRLGILDEPIQWLSDPAYIMPTVIIAVLWMSLGSGFLAFVAGLQGVDRSQYEAGSVDGIRNRMQELWYITLPSMRPQLMFGAIMSITASFAAGDVVINLIGFPSTDYAGHTIVAHLMDYGNIRFEMGYACAIATILFIVMIGVNKIVQKMLSKVGQ